MDKKKRKGFIKIPEYPGGNVGFKKFIRENMQYPVEAMQKRVEGVVNMEIQVDDKGKVISAKVINGIGSGCDEEALRLARMLRYGGVNNKGIRVKSTKKIRIAFVLKDHQKVNQIVNYEIKKTEPAKTEEKLQQEGETYGYTISF